MLIRDGGLRPWRDGLEDGGVPLGERLDGDELLDAMVAVLPQYAQMQRDLASHADELLDLGVADMRVETIPGRFEEALVAVGAYVERRDHAAERRLYEQVAAQGDAVADWCERLAAAPGAASLDHNDLHPWNVFVPEAARASTTGVTAWWPTPSPACARRSRS